MAVSDWFRPKWEHSKEGIRLEAVRALTDQKILERIAIHDSSGSVRSAAVERLTDESILADIAKQDSDESVAIAAVRRISDQKVLAALAKEGTRKDGDRVCEEAMIRITDQKVLGDIAQKAARKGIRGAAVERVHDQSVLDILAKYSEDSAVCLAALQRVAGSAALVYAANYNQSADARECALARITDLDDLLRVAVNATRCSSVLPRITDSVALTELAICANAYSVRTTALAQLTDQTSLARVAAGSLFEDTRQAALSRVTDQVVLATEQERADNERNNLPTVWFSDNDQDDQLCRVDISGEREEALPIHKAYWTQQVENTLYFQKSPEPDHDGVVERLVLPKGEPDALHFEVSGRPLFVDGDWLYFVGSGDAAPLSRVMMSTGSVEPVLEDNIDEGFAFFTLENDTVYYRNCDDKKTLYRATIGGSDRRKLTDDALRGSFDSSHPFRLHGEHIFYSNRDDGGRLYRIGKDGSGRVKLTDFSVDLTAIKGDWIYFTDNGLFRMRLDGSGRVRLGGQKCWGASLIGKWLVHTNVDDGHKLYRTSTNGLHCTRLSTKRVSLHKQEPYKYLAG